MTELTPPAGYQNYHILIVPSLPGSLLASYTPGYMELLADEDTQELVVGDGSTVGGAYRIGAGTAGANNWTIIHVDGASPVTDLSPTAANSQLTVAGQYGFVFTTDTVGKRLIGAMPIPGPVGESLLSTGSAWVSGPPSGTVFGRSIAFGVWGEEGDYTTALVEETTGRHYLDRAVITPPTNGQALIYSSSSGGYVGGAGGAGGGGVSATIDLLANFTSDTTNPPSNVYYNGVRALSFSNTTSQTIYGHMRWPAGSSFAIKLTNSSLTATTGVFGWGFSMMKITPGAAASIKTDDYAAENLGSGTVSGTINRPTEINIAVTNTDSAAEGDYVRWKLRRNTSVGSNAAGLAELWVAQFIPTA